MGNLQYACLIFSLLEHPGVKIWLAIRNEGFGDKNKMSFFNITNSADQYGFEYYFKLRDHRCGYYEHLPEEVTPTIVFEQHCTEAGVYMCQVMCPCPTEDIPREGRVRVTEGSGQMKTAKYVD